MHSDEYLCPNCVTPWKCNGPHIPESFLYSQPDEPAITYRIPVSNHAATPKPHCDTCTCNADTDTLADPDPEC